MRLGAVVDAVVARARTATLRAPFVALSGIDGSGKSTTIFIRRNDYTFAATAGGGRYHLRQRHRRSAAVVACDTEDDNSDNRRPDAIDSCSGADSS
jgi:hypothetical protein